MTKTTKIICFSAIGLILAVIIAVNIVCGVFSGFITTYLYGFGINVNENYEQTQEAGNELCKEIGAEGIIMLKNKDNALPLSESVKKLNVFGWGATDGGYLVAGTGSGFAAGNEYRQRILLLESLTNAGYEYNTEIIEMYKAYQSERQGDSLLQHGWSDSKFFRLYEPAVSEILLNNAKAFSDTALIVISRIGGEDRDLPKVQYKGTDKEETTDTSRHYLQLSTEEESLVNTVKNNFSKVIVLINSCSIMELGFVNDVNISAALSVGTLGQTGSDAIGKILKGEINPSGKTVDTWVYNLKNDPAYANSGAEGTNKYPDVKDKYVDYAEGIYLGYRYFETAAKEDSIKYDDVVQYPFGYGLSYTDFKWDVDDVKPKGTLSKGDKIEVKVHVTNTGTVAGKDVVELYYTVPYKRGGIEKPYIQLGAFAKTGELPAGKSQSLTLSFDVYDMASYDCYDKNGNGFSGYELEAGEYEIRLQTDSHNLADCDDNVTKFTVASDIRYDKDPVTDYEVKNLFTGAGAENGIALDGSNTNAGITYMSRTDFKGTFPSQLKPVRERSANIKSLGDKPGYNAVLDVEKPTQGVDRGSIVLTYQDGKDTVRQEDVYLTLGGDYDDPLWEPFLSQLTVAEMADLILRGGYNTGEIKAIGKVKCLDLDGPAGLNTSVQSDLQMKVWTNYPSETVIASTWNPQLSYIYGLAMGAEASMTSVSGWYAPAVNLHRSAFAGRNFEYYSEDPYLSGMMGAQTVRGARATGLYCYVKHFVGNETETSRSGLYTWMTEQALREIYLRPFEMCVKTGGANAMMTTFNRLGAVWTGGSKALCTTILRNEWGFKGSVITDWSLGGGYMNPDQGIRAGNDLWLPGPGVASGLDDRSSNTAIYAMRRSVKNILYTHTNAYYVAYHHDSSEDRFVAEIGLRQPAAVFPWWVLGLVAIDVAAAGGLGVWCYFLLRKLKRQPA